MKNKKKLEEKREKKREEMRRYRERKREQGFSKKRGSLPMLPTPKQQAAKKREKKKRIEFEREQKQNYNSWKLNVGNLLLKEHKCGAFLLLDLPALKEEPPRKQKIPYPRHQSSVLVL